MVGSILVEYESERSHMDLIQRVCCPLFRPQGHNWALSWDPLGTIGALVLNPGPYVHVQTVFLHSCREAISALLFLLVLLPGAIA